jgi:c-di-GMP-binding flagellar brake protein YcgR
VDRRFNERWSIELIVRITDEDSKEWTGELLDISESGIGVLLPIGIEPGSLLNVELLKVQLTGEVTYANPNGDMFRIGIAIEPSLLETSRISEIVRNHITQHV